MTNGILSDQEHEIEIKKSRFICFSRYVKTKEEAEAFILEIKNLHHGATHNCSCYIIGNIEKMDDDGEPAQTAGLPMIEVLKRHNLDNICVVTTRYFGGIKLGGGGLIRAYAKSVSNLINNSPIDTMDLGYQLELTMSYSDTKIIEHYIASNSILIVDKKYEQRVFYKIAVFQDEYDKIKSELNNINHLIEIKINKEISLIRS